MFTRDILRDCLQKTVQLLHVAGGRMKTATRMKADVETVHETSMKVAGKGLVGVRG